jgi:hypothetical protein
VAYFTPCFIVVDNTDPLFLAADCRTELFIVKYEGPNYHRNFNLHR